MNFLQRLLGVNKEPDIPAFDALIAQSMEELSLKTSAHDGMWQIRSADWNVDLDGGTLMFTASGGTVATCDVQIIGTRNTEDGSWMWGWKHPSVPVPLQRHARVVREYGAKHNDRWLTVQMLEMPEDKAWQLTALACKLNEAQGAYRGPVGPTELFMTFGNVRLTKVQ